MGINHLLRKLILKEKASSEDYLNYLRKNGAEIGTDVHIYSPNHTYIDEQFPYMLTIGNHVHITLGCHILNHDYSWSVGKVKYGDVLGGVGKVMIGNNVFVGVNSVNLMNTCIGDNVIIGAGSVVKGNIPSDCVAGGGIAKPIMGIEEYWERRKQRQYSEAAEMVKAYRKRFSCDPPKEKLPAYFFLFESRKPIDNGIFDSRMHAGGNYESSMNAFMNTEPMFASYEKFLSSVRD